jgi:hypothetical protein
MKRPPIEWLLFILCLELAYICGWISGAGLLTVIGRILE